MSLKQIGKTLGFSPIWRRQNCSFYEIRAPRNWANYDFGKFQRVKIWIPTKFHWPKFDNQWKLIFLRDVCRNFVNLFLSNRNHLDIIQFFDDWITGRTKILRENAYQLSKTQLEEKIQDRAMHVSFTEKVSIFWAFLIIFGHSWSFWTLLGYFGQILPC